MEERAQRAPIGNRVCEYVWGLRVRWMLKGCGYLQDPKILNTRPKFDFPKYPWL